MADLALTNIFADLPHIANSDPRPAIDGEMSDFGIGRESPMISKSEIFDGLADGMQSYENIFNGAISTAYDTRLIIEWE